MEIYVNGEPRQVPEPCTVTQLLETLGIKGQRLALEINEQIVSKSQHDTHQFNAGDKVEIVHAIGGG